MVNQSFTVSTVATIVTTRVATMIVTDKSASIRQLYAYLPSRDFSQSVLATRPPSLAVLPVTGVAWCDLGEPRRVVAMRACLNAAPARPGRGGLMSA